MENPIKNGMMTRGRPILGNHHMEIYGDIWGFPNHPKFTWGFSIYLHYISYILSIIYCISIYIYKYILDIAVTFIWGCPNHPKFNGILHISTLCFNIIVIFMGYIES